MEELIDNLFKWGSQKTEIRLRIDKYKLVDKEIRVEKGIFLESGVSLPSNTRIKPVGIDIDAFRGEPFSMMGIIYNMSCDGHNILDLEFILPPSVPSWESTLYGVVKGVKSNEVEYIKGEDMKELTGQEAVDFINKLNISMGWKAQYKLDSKLTVDQVILGEFTEEDLDTINKAFEHKPNKQPIIKKSGNTWVAEYKGVDYLCILPDTPMNLLEDMTPHKIKSFWKPISEIEITDEIALLRPMIKHGNTPNCLDVLYGVMHRGEELAIILDGEENMIETYEASRFQLATVKDLEEK